MLIEVVDALEVDVADDVLSLVADDVLSLVVVDVLVATVAVPVIEIEESVFWNNNGVPEEPVHKVGFR